MNVHEIVTEWLVKNGYEGLSNPSLECGCRMDDLMPCQEPHCTDCVAGHHDMYDDIMVPGKRGRPEWTVLTK